MTLRPRVLSFVFIASTLLPVAAWADGDQTKASSAGAVAAPGREADSPPPGIDPSTWARVPKQVEQDPFALTTIGIEVIAFTPVASGWPFPSSDGRFQRVVAPRLRQQDVYIGALHFFGHADIFVSFPLGSPSAARSMAGRSVSTTRWLPAPRSIHGPSDREHCVRTCRQAS